MCPKCGGFCIRERCHDTRAESERWVELDRCVCCGFYNDHIMTINRRACGIYYKGK